MTDTPPAERLAALFDRASELEPVARQALLDELRLADPAMAGELASLLAFAPGACERFAVPALARLGPPAPGADRSLGERVGPFRLLREIGRGGMGRVFLAVEERDAFERRVALKLPDRLGFEAERLRYLREEIRILASLEHRGIARFLDGGQLADGTWYLALEYVEGVDLLTYARELGLGRRERLRLFREMLEAVAYAHDRGVVHRDLKPSNVLVDADGRPRLLDFGVAKLLEGTPSAATATEARAFTPAYASPEQFAGGAVSPATDVFSAGVILYELLTGVRPHQEHEASCADLERAVLSTEPLAPSARRRRTTRRPPVAGRAPSSSSGPPFRLDRDLDAICLEALRRDPAARYANARELASDLDRYFAGLPVVARRGGAVYRASTLLRRHRRALLVAAVLAVGLAAGWRLAPRLLRSPGVALEIPAPPPRSAPLAEIGALSARFAASPGRPEVGLALVEALLARGRGEEAMAAINRLRQVPGLGALALRVDLAEADVALAVSELQRAAHVAGGAIEAAAQSSDPSFALRARLTQAEALLRFSSPEESERRLAAIFADAERARQPKLAARALLVRAQAARRGARADEAAALVDQALRVFEALGERAGVAESLTWRARLEGESGQLDAGLASADEALRIARELGHLEREGSALATRSALHNWRGDDAAAERDCLEAVSRLRLAGNRELLLTQLTNLALSRVEQSEFAEATALATEAEALSRVVGNPAQRGSVLRARGYIEESRGDHDAARSSYQGAVLAAREAGADEAAATYLSDLAWLEFNADRPQLAADAAREAAALLRQGGDERSALQVDVILAWARGRGDDRDGAVRDLDRIEREAGRMGSDSLAYSVVLIRAELAELAGDWARTVELRRRAVAMASEFGSAGLVLSQRLQLAQALARSGAAEESHDLAAEVGAEADRLGRSDIAQAAREIAVASVPRPMG